MGARIGLDVTAGARQGAGIGRYVRELTSALACREDDYSYRAFCCAAGVSAGSLPQQSSRLRIRDVPISDRYLNALWYRARIPLPVQVLTGRIDLFHSPDFTLPPALGKPTILTIHDLAFLTVPDCAFPTLRDYLTAVVPRSARRASHIIAVSDSTRRDVIRLLDVPESCVTTIHEGVSPSFQPVQCDQAEPALRNLRIRSPYILSVGTLEPRKNYVRLIEAFDLLRRMGLEHQLVIAGRPGWLYDPVFEAVRAHGLETAIRFVQPDDGVLKVLYSCASVFVYPSLYEGFGIPLLEALACGAPVACSNSSALPEVVGDAAELFDPRDVEAIAAAVRKIVDNPVRSNELRLRGSSRAAGFSWANAAAQTTDLYETVLACHG